MIMKYQVPSDCLVHQMIKPFASNQVMWQVAWFPCFFCIKYQGKWTLDTCCAISSGSHPLSIDTRGIPIRHWKLCSSFGAYWLALKFTKSAITLYPYANLWAFPRVEGLALAMASAASAASYLARRALKALSKCGWAPAWWLPISRQ